MENVFVTRSAVNDVDDNYIQLIEQNNIRIPMVAYYLKDSVVQICECIVAPDAESIENYTKFYGNGISEQVLPEPIVMAQGSENPNVLKLWGEAWNKVKLGDFLALDHVSNAVITMGIHTYLLLDGNNKKLVGSISKSLKKYKDIDGDAEYLETDISNVIKRLDAIILEAMGLSKPENDDETVAEAEVESEEEV